MITYPNVKLNIGLRVLRKRDDGYHDIDTLFVPYMEIHDTLEIITGDDFSRTSASLFARYGEGGMLYGSAEAGSCDGDAPTLAQGISDDGKLMITIAREEGVDWDPLKDLTARAYGILDAEYKLPPVKIFLEKTSPVGAGLGGGSSDAAFALKMLSGMFSLGLSEQQLAAYAARLGSDCAFFIYNRPMLGSGRGEILEDCPVDVFASGKYDVKVIVPEGISVSTADAYGGIIPYEAAVPDSEAQTPGSRDASSSAAAQVAYIPVKDIVALPVERWKELLFNDFEMTVFRKYPRLALLKDSLYDCGAVYASMSGSGSACYGIFTSN